MSAHGRLARRKALGGLGTLFLAAGTALIILSGLDDTAPPALLLYWGAPRAPPPPPPSLAPLKSAAPQGFNFGTAHNDLRVFRLGDDAVSRYEREVARHFNIVTPENACKPSTIATSPDNLTWDFSACDRVLAFAEANSLKMRLHTLAWGEWNPKWMEDLPMAERRNVLHAYMAAVLGRYRDRSGVAYVDVVNEACCDNIAFTASKQNCDPALGTLKAGQWFPAIRDYLDDVFAFAREVAPPHAKLVYNDYGAESLMDPTDPDKADRVYETVRQALVWGVPIDAVGFQFHVSDMHGGHGMTGSALFKHWIEGVKRNFHRFAHLGVEIHVTEIDVGCNMPTLTCVHGFGYSSASASRSRRASLRRSSMRASVCPSAPPTRRGAGQIVSRGEMRARHLAGSPRTRRRSCLMRHTSPRRRRSQWSARSAPTVRLRRGWKPRWRHHQGVADRSAPSDRWLIAQCTMTHPHHQGGPRDYCSADSTIRAYA